MILDKGELYPHGVFKLLKTDGVAHVATGPVEFVAQQVRDLQPAGVGPQPFVHFIERLPVGAAFGGLGHDELADNIPTFLLRSLPIDAESVYRYLREHDDNPCVVIPTAGGKTPVSRSLFKASSACFSRVPAFPAAIGIAIYRAKSDAWISAR